MTDVDLEFVRTMLKNGPACKYDAHTRNRCYKLAGGWLEKAAADDWVLIAGTLDRMVSQLTPQERIFLNLTS